VSGYVTDGFVSVVGSQINTSIELLVVTKELGLSDVYTNTGMMGLSNDPSYDNVFENAYKVG
jgi:hypothetical protein